jgi:hypothetical protein
MATSMVLGVALSGLGPLGAGIAASAGEFANQSFQIGLGRKEWSDYDIERDLGAVGEAGLTGLVAGELSKRGSAAAAASGGGLAAQAVAQAGAAAATYAVNSGIHEAFHRGEASRSFSGWSLLTAVAGGAATPVLGGFFSQMYLEALNPKTGWVWHPNARAWDALYQELAMGLGQVVIQDSFGSPQTDAPRPEQRSQSPLPPELLNAWDELDRQYIEELDRMARLAQNQQIAEASDESLQFQLQMSALDDSIAHIGEAIDDRAIIASTLNQKNHERRMQREQAAAAWQRRMARRQANQERLQAQIAAGPSGSLLEQASDMDRVDSGGQWDDYGVYWHVDEEGRTSLWTEAKREWRVLGTPDDAMKLSGLAPSTVAANRAAEANNDAYRRFLHGPARQYARDYGVIGVPTILTGKLAAAAVEKGQQVISPELSIAVSPGTVLLENNSQRLRDVEAEIAAEKDRRDMIAEAQIAHEHGELFRMPVVVASTEQIDESAPLDPMVVAGTTTQTGKPARSPARVEGLIRDITATYRGEIVNARRANPRATASWVGLEAERRTLAQVDTLARARGLNPGHIWVQNFPMGVTGPKGGAVSAEIGSPHYGFVVELKKSPNAVGGFQAEAHLVSVNNSLNFPEGGVYFRIYGERYKGFGVDRLQMGAELERQKVKLPRAPKVRLR